MSTNKKPPGDLKLVSTSNPPTVGAGKISQATWKRFRRLEQLADSIVKIDEKLTGQCLASRLYDDDEPDLARLTADDVADIARARTLLAEFDRDELYEQDNEGDRVLKDIIIVDRLTLLMSAVALGKPRTPDEAGGFATLLIAHVTDREPSFLVLESACRALEGREKFSQTIAEVSGELAEQQKLWTARRRALDDIEITAKQALAQTEKARAAWRLRRAGQDVRKARLLVADRRSDMTAWAARIAREQDIARDAYQRAETARREREEIQRELDEATVTLAAAEAALAALQPPSKQITVAY
jgi:hypothetical protein